MNRASLLLFLLMVCPFPGRSQQMAKITGYAPNYVGKTIEILKIQDYLSHREQHLGMATVKEDSTFEAYFPLDTVQKVIIRGGNNHGYMYIQPGAHYKVGVPDQNPYDPYRPDGNEIEVLFYGLDSTDINYKILGFQRWIDNFIGNYYHLRSADGTQYMEELDKFKTNVETAYKDDTTDVNSLFFHIYVRYTMAGLDNVNNSGERNRYEKYDFYINQNRIHYHNDAYMAYIDGFYENIIPRLHSDANNQLYQGVLRSSPSVVLHSLRTEYTLSTVRLRELIMIKALSDMYHSGEFPQTNLLTILDSVARFGLFKENRTVAKNMLFRLTDLVPGIPAPDFVLAETGKQTRTKLAFNDKYLYLIFLNPDSDRNIQELPLLNDIHKRYGEYIQFVTVYSKSDSTTAATLNQLDSLPWMSYQLQNTNPIWKKYRVNSFPHYTLIDVTGNIVASPALGPRPNGQYETIDKVFFEIRKHTLMNQNRSGETGSPDHR